MNPPDRGWLDFGKLLFGFLLLLILATLAVIIGVGKVEATTSFGLDIILGGLLTLSGAFCGWCFKEKQVEPRAED